MNNNGNYYVYWDSRQIIVILRRLSLTTFTLYLDNNPFWNVCIPTWRNQTLLNPSNLYPTLLSNRPLITHFIWWTRIQTQIQLIRPRSAPDPTLSPPGPLLSVPVFWEIVPDFIPHYGAVARSVLWFIQKCPDIWRYFYTKGFFISGATKEKKGGGGRDAKTYILKQTRPPQ